MTVKSVAEVGHHVAQWRKSYGVEYSLCIWYSNMERTEMFSIDNDISHFGIQLPAK